MYILGLSDEIPPRTISLIFTQDTQKSASLYPKMYSFGLSGEMSQRRLSLMFTSDPYELKIKETATL